MLKAILEWFTILVLFFFIAFTIAKISVEYKQYKADAQTTALFEQRLEHTKVRLSKVQENLSLLRKDNSYYEHIIRENLGWVKEGEKIYILDE